ncbi:hypothetical protein WG66_016075 [Moniliophthora roreri]|uniref:Uncharacterized protein n=1 Tax=Moniliophthora roreri TaxID=221103 RepID=A0A0W0FX53_MONRR|nr:hypothetical protein WG66_016075 [Moniliophthora roreri]
MGDYYVPGQPIDDTSPSECCWNNTSLGGDIRCLWRVWKHTIWLDTSVSDVNLRLRDPSGFRGSKWKSPEGLERYSDLAPSPRIRNPTLHHPEEIRRLFCRQYWMTLVRTSPTLDIALAQTFLPAIGSQRASLQQYAGLRFVIPSSVVDSLWTHDDAFIRNRNLRLLPFFEDAWGSWSGYPEVRHDNERLAFILALTKHLKRSDRTSALLTSNRGQRFIRFVHDEIISRRLYQPPPWGDVLRHLLMLEWVSATRRTQEVGNLPIDHFAPIPRLKQSVLPRLTPTIPPIKRTKTRFLVLPYRMMTVNGKGMWNKVNKTTLGEVGADECV